MGGGGERKREGRRKKEEERGRRKEREDREEREGRSRGRKWEIGQMLIVCVHGVNQLCSA